MTRKEPLGHPLGNQCGDEVSEVAGCACGDDKPETGCCSTPTPVSLTAEPERTEPWILGQVMVAGRPFPQVSTRLTWSDRVGSWKRRWSIGRMSYRVKPGLYAVGQATPKSPVLVSANYKMSFDHLRQALHGLDAWILVIDTKAVNVWCAAGKGTFGTDEIVRRVKTVALEAVVSHRRLIVPQLGAPGVSARKVREETGFGVRYGPVRATDIPEFLKAKSKATDEMRRVRFTLGNRLVLIPTELVQTAKWALGSAVLFWLFSGVNGWSFDAGALVGQGLANALAITLAFVVGASLPAALLPWIPGRAFSIKGALVGALYVALLGWLFPTLLTNLWTTVGWLLVSTAACAYNAMNFTGCSTYTSLSGVLKEMRYAVPLQIVGGALGLLLWITGRVVEGIS